MRSFLVALSVAALLIMTGAMALAAPPGPKDDRHGPPSLTPVAASDRHDPADGPEAKNERNGDQPNRGAASLSKRHGAAGTVQNATSAGFDLVTKQGTLHVVVGSATEFSIKNKPDAKVDDFTATVNGAGNAKTRVNVHGTPGPGTNELTAKMVHVIPGKPSFEHVVGNVEDYKAASGDTSGSIKVKGQVFVVTSKTEIEPSGSTPKVGDWVTVVATKDATPTARGIAIHEPKKD